MNYEDLLTALRQEPFEPFRMVLTDGKVHEVRHPDLVWVGRRTCLIAFRAPDAPIFERYDTIALVHIIRLEPMTNQPAA